MIEPLHRAVVSLGSNIDKEQNLPAAVELLRRSATVVAASTVYETAAVGAREEQPSYFNAAVLILTEVSPAELKDGLLADIERKLGRTRTHDKYAARTIDLDIALFDNAAFDYVPADGRARHIPDPDILRFPHVAVPVSEVAPNAVHPETGEPLVAIAGRLLAKATATGQSTFRPRPDIDLTR